jgi:hypothetical protein
MRLAKTKFLIILTLMLLCMGVFAATAYAYEEALAVNAAWLDGELLRINVTDINGGTSALALRLEDYMYGTESEEYISIQAVDLQGNTSAVIRIRNPFYDPEVLEEIPEQDIPPMESSTPGYDGQVGSMRPLTPDGTGTVVDNAHDSDGIEFFTIGTEDGNVFYLIIDRQRSTDNVYLLNAVTEEVLISLAEAGGREVAAAGSTVSAIPAPELPDDPDEEAGQQPPEYETPEPENGAPETQGGDNSMLVIIGIAVLAVGGLGYYFKIVRPKRNSIYDDDDDEEDNYGYDGEPDDEDGDGR